jgi:uncharacterized membrane protein
MAYCVQCGHQVGDADKFCPGCGRQQNAASGSSSSSNPANFWANVTDSNAALFCYIPWIGWIAAIAVLASGQYKGNKRVHFHAFQGLYLFVAWLLVDWVVSPVMRFGPGFPGQMIPRLLSLAVFGAWIFMIIKVHQEEDYHLPILGELADRSVSEQRG